MTTALHETETHQVLEPVEHDLLRSTGGAAVHWYGRAATALYRVFQIARHLHRDSASAEVILPAISCATPANAALLAGVRPRFADVDPENGMPTLQTIRERATSNTRAVVFVHLFGQTADLRPLAEWCHANGILLIEDLAQALGALLPDGTAAGSVGDFAVYSFNPTKILECGGGALLIGNSNFVDSVLQLGETDPLPPRRDDTRVSALALSYRNLHHSLVALRRTRTIDEISSAFLKLQPAYQALYLRPIANPAALLHAWAQLKSVLRHRLENAEQYSQILAGGQWQILGQWRQSGVCWRYSLLVDFPEQLASFSEAVRRDGFHVSNLYWPANDFFLPTDACPNAESFARRIVNLWVDNSVDRQWVSNCATSMMRNIPMLKNG